MRSYRGWRTYRKGRPWRAAPSCHHGSAGCRDGSIFGALNGCCPRLCVTGQKTIQHCSPCFHDRLCDNHILRQFPAVFCEQPTRSVFGVFARVFPSVQVACSRVHSGQLRLGLVLWDINAVCVTDLWRKHSQNCTAPCDDLEAELYVSLGWSGLRSHLHRASLSASLVGGQQELLFSSCSRKCLEVISPGPGRLPHPNKPHILVSSSRRSIWQTPRPPTPPPIFSG